ncbi:MAG TPA: YegS/Rv2252/BmrU family lipid kinase [Deltaproteobacteria bacterium]|nr:YegS/Rv2252/BmrU family lipid kinase [Deltaproteobacteria bacterium]
MKIRFIVNPMAGGGNKTAEITEVVREVFADEHGLFDIKATKKPGDAYRYAKDAVERGFGTVYACGGDGTVNEVASALTGSAAALGIVATGRGNGLADALGLPRDPAAAMRLALKGATRKVDAGTIEGRYFFSSVSFAFEAFLDRRAGAEGRRGAASCMPLALWWFLAYRPARVAIRWKENRLRATPFVLTVANTERLGGGTRAAPGARPDDGLLDLCLLPQAGLRETARSIALLYGGSIEEARGFRRIRAASLEIERDRPGPIHIDGEPVDCADRVRIETAPRALNVLAAEPGAPCAAPDGGHNESR